MNLILVGPKQTELQFRNDSGFCRVLFSYETPVAAVVNGICYRTNKKWSNTTSRHIAKWFGGHMSAMVAQEMEQSFFDNLIK